ncbi:hypothetical protein Brsp07_04904 [Brucella sp. NBRC 14130]
MGLRERQRLIRRENILAAASDLFAAHSFNEVSLEAVAARATVSVPTIYSFFKSKHDLLLGLLEEDRHILEPNLARVVERLPNDPVQAMVLIAKSVLLDGYDISRKGVWREILGASIHMGPEQRSQFRELLSITAKHVRVALNKLRGTGSIHDDVDLDSAARIIHSVIRHVFVLYITSEEATVDDLTAMLEEDLKTVLLGIAIRA